MSSFHFDSLKAEKADAMRRFNRRKSLTSSVKLIGASSLFLYSYVTIINLLSPFFTLTTTTTSQQFYTFILINIIVFLIYKSSTAETPVTSHGGGGAAAAPQPDVHDEYVSISSYRQETTKTTWGDGKGLQLVDLPPVPEEEIPTSSSEQEEVCGGACKDLTVVDNAVGFSEDRCAANPVRDVMVVDDYDGRCLRRTRSEKGSGGAGKVVLRRSETVNGGGRKSVEEMDNEEFNMEIEKFIANKRKILREELMSTVEEKDPI